MNETEDRLLSVLAALAATLESSPAPSMIIVGIAVIADGIPRQTIDTDASHR